MYNLIHNYKETEEGKVLNEKEYFFGDTFRLKKNATHELQNLQNEFREMGYTATLTKSSRLYCFKSKITNDEKLKVTEWEIIVKKI